MTSQEIADMVFNFKDKLTDKEFKDVMDKLAIKKKDEGNIYEVRYIKQKRKLTYGDGGLFYKIDPSYKVKNVKIPDGDEELKNLIDELIEVIKDNKSYKIPPIDIRKKNGENYFTFSANPILWCNNPYQKKANCECGNCESDDDEDDDRAKQKGAFIGFCDILIVSIEKK